MRLLTWFTAVVFAITLAGIVPAVAQDKLDSVKVDPTHHKVVLENDQVRVVSWVIPVKDKTLNHSHPNNVVILLTNYNAKVTTPDGKTNEVHFKAGSAMWREAGMHVVENIGREEMRGIIVEPKK